MPAALLRREIDHDKGPRRLQASQNRTPAIPERHNVSEDERRECLGARIGNHPACFATVKMLESWVDYEVEWVTEQLIRAEPSADSQWSACHLDGNGEWSPCWLDEARGSHATRLG